MGQYYDSVAALHKRLVDAAGRAEPIPAPDNWQLALEALYPQHPLNNDTEDLEQSTLEITASISDEGHMQPVQVMPEPEWDDDAEEDDELDLTPPRLSVDSLRTDIQVFAWQLLQRIISDKQAKPALRAQACQGQDALALLYYLKKLHFIASNNDKRCFVYSQKQQKSRSDTKDQRPYEYTISEHFHTWLTRGAGQKHKHTIEGIHTTIQGETQASSKAYKRALRQLLQHRSPEMRFYFQQYPQLQGVLQKDIKTLITVFHDFHEACQQIKKTVTRQPSSPAPLTRSGSHFCLNPLSRHHTAPVGQLADSFTAAATASDDRYYDSKPRAI